MKLEINDLVAVGGLTMLGGGLWWWLNPGAAAAGVGVVLVLLAVLRTMFEGG